MAEREQPQRDPDVGDAPDVEHAAAELAEMPVTWVDTLGRVMERWVPDALTTAIGLMVILVGLSMVVGGTAMETLDAYYEGLWMFLKFTMQVTLILVLSLIVTYSPLFKNLVVLMARIPRTRVQVVALAALCMGGLAYLTWALSLALGPVIAIHFCREAERKDIPVDFLFLLAVMAGAGSIWQFGLSASAPLMMATPGQTIVAGMETMPLVSTIWSWAAMVHVVVFLLAVIVVGCWLMPVRVRPLSEFDAAMKLAADAIFLIPAKDGAPTSQRPASRYRIPVTVTFLCSISAGSAVPPPWRAIRAQASPSAGSSTSLTREAASA